MYFAQNTSDQTSAQLLGFYIQCVGFIASQILTVAGNLVVILSFYVEPRLRKPKYLFILSLSVADLIVGIFSMPVYSFYLTLGYWPFTTLTCDVWLSIDYACCQVSVLNLIMISVDRLWAIKRPIGYRSRMSSTRALAMIIPTWTLPFVVYFSLIVGWPHIHEDSRPSTECYVPFLTESPLFMTVSTVVAFWIPTVILWSIYAYIYCIIKRIDKERSNRRYGGERKAKKTLTLILGVFFLTWSPYSIVVIIMAYYPGSIPVVVYHICYYLCYLNSTLNPLCYALSNEHFKHAFHNLLCTKRKTGANN
jgi:hypothetical protein